MAGLEHRHHHHGHQHLPRGHFPSPLDEKLLRIIRENLVSPDTRPRPPWRGWGAYVPLPRLCLHAAPLAAGHRRGSHGGMDASVTSYHVLHLGRPGASCVHQGVVFLPAGALWRWRGRLA